MGGSYQSKEIPEKIKAMSPTDKSPNVEIEYCQAWGGLPEANYTKNFISHVYPNGKYKIFSPGVTNKLRVVVDGKQVYEKGKGKMNNEHAYTLMNEITKTAWSRERKELRLNEASRRNTGSLKQKSVLILWLWIRIQKI